jgi:hypothetical protein
MFTVLWFFVLVAWIMCLFQILRDIFRSRDLSGFAKAMWTLLIVVLPIIGVLCYIGARGGAMQERDAEEMAARDMAMKQYIRDAVANPPAAAR